MDEAEEIQNAKDARDTTWAALISSEERSSSVADEFIRLEVQIATILFAFSSLALGQFQGGSIKIAIVGGYLVLMKLGFIFSMFSLITSLALGLLHLKKNEQFWDYTLHKRALRFEKWNEVAKRESSFKEALAFQEGTRLGKGPVVAVPKWTWVLQTISLSIAVVILFTLSVIFIFS